MFYSTKCFNICVKQLAQSISTDKDAQLPSKAFLMISSLQ